MDYTNADRLRDLLIFGVPVVALIVTMQVAMWRQRAHDLRMKADIRRAMREARRLA